MAWIDIAGKLMATGGLLFFVSFFCAFLFADAILKASNATTKVVAADYFAIALLMSVIASLVMMLGGGFVYIWAR